MYASRHFPFVATLAMLAGLAACADTAEPSTASQASDRQCFRPEEVVGFDARGRDTVYFRVGTRDVYRAELTGVCPEIDWSQRIAIRTLGGGGWVCRGLDAELLVPRPGGGVDRCLVTNIVALTLEEAQAYRERRR